MRFSPIPSSRRGRTSSRRGVGASDEATKRRSDDRTDLGSGRAQRARAVNAYVLAQRSARPRSSLLSPSVERRARSMASSSSRTSLCHLPRDRPAFRSRRYASVRGRHRAVSSWEIKRRNRRWGKNSRDAPHLMPRVPETPRPLGYSLCAAFGRKNSQGVYNSGIAS